jgi:hypothetical protein
MSAKEISPLRLEEPTKFPWQLKFFRGDVEWFHIALAHSSDDKTIQDVMDAIHWWPHERERVQKHQAEAVAFARYIVQACNAFPAMRAALQVVFDEYCPTMSLTQNVMDLVTAALAQAGGDADDT